MVRSWDSKIIFKNLQLHTIKIMTSLQLLYSLESPSPYCVTVCVLLVGFPELVPRYYSREAAENAMRYISGTKLDDRIIRVDWDAGFIEGRQYGRGKSGGQVR